MTIRRIDGIDPATGDVLEIEADARIQGIRRRRTDRPLDLPLLAPGLVDLQVNGFAGHDVNAEDPSPEAIIAIARSLALRGVTSWVPTVVTASEERIIAALRAVERACAMDPATAAAIPFSHVEGPFLSAQDGPRGVHDPAQIRPADAAEVARWQRAGRVGYVTLSPHGADAPQQIARIVASGTAVAIGHTHASPEQIRAAVDAGAELSTHLGNGIFPQLPRHPNPIWEQLAESRLSCGFIADGHHLPMAALRSMLQAVGRGRAYLVSDCVELAGSTPGTYITPVGGEVELSSTGRLSYAGTALLAGAAKDLAGGAEVLVHAGLGVDEVLDLASRTPGRIIRGLLPATDGHAGPEGRERPRVGDLRVGAAADLVHLDRAGRVQGVVRGGRPLP
ncbi:N-acetylglucosamine-6-phosphate deacetylase [Brachybacterium hainanense]|uniref:N-acetylglucosamine-6-phosphate deacetylase n=1 Tax=Brachybacterium hainanense TaxID=1541174 RepID=A0ABV6RC86_9MICO